MAKIFITGITGFLGSNIADYLIKNGHDIAATYRVLSSKDLCQKFEDKVTWIPQDENWQSSAINFGPQVIIHCAWIGVGHEERNKWEIQATNINYIQDILTVAQTAGVAKFVALGSQAEYGAYNGCVKEEHYLDPKEAYGCVKVVCSELVKQFCNYQKIEWYWLRLFSFFGKGESDKWLIPSLIKKMLTTNFIDLTPGEQQYAYLYVEDLGVAIEKVIVGCGKSGIYNISGKQLVTLRNLIVNVRNKINPSFQLNFGKLAYRENQSMIMRGDTSKFIAEFGTFEISNFNESLDMVISDTKEQIQRSINESI